MEMARMTDRAEIERLLNQTGRTLEGLPTQSDYLYADDHIEKHEEIGEMMWAVKFTLDEPYIQHQSDVIELLVGALRDALTERDAAIKDIPRACGYCKNYNDPPRVEESEHGTLVTYCEKECHNISGVNTGWEWRGVKKNGCGDQWQGAGGDQQEHRRSEADAVLGIKGGKKHE